MKEAALSSSRLSKNLFPSRGRVPYSRLCLLLLKRTQSAHGETKRFLSGIRRASGWPTAGTACHTANGWLTAAKLLYSEFQGFLRFFRKLSTVKQRPVGAVRSANC